MAFPNPKAFVQLAFAAFVLAILAGPTPAQTKDAPKSRPNILFIYSDDQRWDALGVTQREQGDKARFPWLKTPHLDKLAGQGVRFRNGFVVNSLCAPSRASFLTGKYGHVNGVVNNHTPFPVDNVTWATLLRRVGYVTGYIGKWHMGSQSGQRPGFDFSASFKGQGKYFDCPIEVNGVSTPSSGWVDDVSTDYAVKFMKENMEKPFALAVGFKATHGPFDPPPRHKDTFGGETARPVPSLGTTAIYKEEAGKQVVKTGTNLNYFRCVAAVDDNVGKLMQALDDLGLAENTIVVFCSDNGYYLGEHGLGDKRTAYEESLRIPYIVRYPAGSRPRRALDSMVLNVDLAPTILDYAGVEIPKGTHGRSIRPLLEGRVVEWRKAWFYCYFFESGFAQPMTTAVRADNAVLIKYADHEAWTEVFDLAKDPYQLKNLAKDPAAVGLRRDLEAEYERQAKAIDFQVPKFADDPKAPPTPKAKAKAKNKGEAGTSLKQWVLDYALTTEWKGRVEDASPHKNHGQAKGIVWNVGRDGGKAAFFDGKAYIDVPNSKSLNPAVSSWTLEVVVKAEQPSGVILARGGAANGYLLHLEEGRPIFTVVSKNKASRVVGEKSIVGVWTKLAAQIAEDRNIRIFVDDKQVAQAALHDFIRTDPNDSMQIGADLGSPVVTPTPPGFVGAIERVRIYSGDVFADKAR